MRFMIIALVLVASCSAVPQRQRGNQQYQRQQQQAQQQQQQQQPQQQYNQQQYNQQQQSQSQNYNQQQTQQPQQYNQPQQYSQEPQARSFESNPQPKEPQSFKAPISVAEYNKPQPDYRQQSLAHQRAEEYRPKGTLETTTWIPIIRFSKEQENDGSYKTAYETGNNIVAEETGFLKKLPEAEDREALVQHGSYTYTSPEGTLITVQYTADEFGFRATGDHIPTPPPVSPEIQKGLDLIYAGIKANQERLALEAKQNPEAFAKKQADRAALDFTGQYYQQ